MSNNFFEMQRGNRDNLRLGSLVYEGAIIQYRAAMSENAIIPKIDIYGIVSGQNIPCKQMLGNKC